MSVTIKKMIATFGALDHATLTPGDGLTVITAPNESGKSTWIAFLKAMFYGIDTKERDKVGYLADKNRYQPWSGNPQIQDWLFSLVGAVGLTLCAYHQSAFSADRGKRRSFLATSLLTVFACCAALPHTE